MKRAQKAADHAAHEAAEACKRQQATVARQQKRIDDAAASANRRVDRANAKLEKRNGEYGEAQAKLESLTPSTEATAQVQPSTESEIERSKPEPVAPPIAEEPSQPSIAEPSQPLTQNQAPAVEENKPEPTPTPAPQMEEQAPTTNETPEQPKQLPKIASPMELIGLIGLVSMSVRYLVRSGRG